MSHSPLPWGLHDAGTPAPTICKEREDGSCHEIAALTGCQGMSREELLANGELIVRAVNSHDELVAACEALVEYHSNLDRYRGVTIGQLLEQSRHAVQLAREAIAKAKVQPLPYDGPLDATNEELTHIRDNARIGWPPKPADLKRELLSLRQSRAVDSEVDSANNPGV